MKKWPNIGTKVNTYRFEVEYSTQMPCGHQIKTDNEGILTLSAKGHLKHCNKCKKL